MLLELLFESVWLFREHHGALFIGSVSREITTLVGIMQACLVAAEVDMNVPLNTTLPKFNDVPTRPIEMAWPDWADSTIMSMASSMEWVWWSANLVRGACAQRERSFLQ